MNENVTSSYQIARFLSHSSPPLNVWFSQILSSLLKEKTFPMLIPHQPVMPSPPPPPGEAEDKCITPQQITKDTTISFPPFLNKDEMELLESAQVVRIKGLAVKF